jgi:serine/threonine-protein kinase HipA
MKYAICPLTYERIPAKQKYSAQGLKKLARRLQHLDDFPLTANEQRKASIQQVNKVSIQGIQPKISAKLTISRGCFEIADTNGTYILKPQSDIYTQLPENEDLSMRLAKSVGIEVPLHGLIYCKDGSLTYFIKRFDRVGKQKIAVEDFCQLADKKRDEKYDFSTERLIPIIEKYCTFPVIEKTQFLLRTLFNFIIGNEDMHLKNFSLIRHTDKTTLAPAYDFLNTTIVLENSASEELALPLNGKKHNLKKKDFIYYLAYERLKLNPKTVDKILNQINSQIPNWTKLIELSFLKPALKEVYLNLITQRLKIIS